MTRYFRAPSRLMKGLCLMMLATTPSFQAHAAPRTTEFKLANGLQVVVIEDHRAPVVTHMVWYKVGAADEPKGVSGIAHFLEHLMFKSTDKIPLGEFSKIVARLGGQDNAFTGHDVTSYFQRISKERLADRHGHGSRPHGQSAPHREGGSDRARRHPRGAPLAHREQPGRHHGRADERGAVSIRIPTASPSSAGSTRWRSCRREDAMSFYKHYYAPEQRHPRRRRRRDAGRGSKARRGHLRPDSRQSRPCPPCASARRIRRRAPRAASSTRTRAPATPPSIATTSCRATRPRSPARPKRSIS